MATDIKPPLRFKVLMALLSTLLGIGALEVLARIVTRNRAFQPDPTFIRSLEPNNPGLVLSYETDDNLNGRSKEIPAKPVVVGKNPTNNIGFRMPEDVGPKGPNEKRILILGDSYTEAYQVPGASRFTEIADRALRADPKTKEWRVINGGVENGCPAQYHLQLNQWLPELKPDIVVIHLAPNDVADDQSYQRWYGYEFDDQGMPKAVKATTRLWLQKNVFLIRAVEVMAVTGRAPWLAALGFPDASPEVKPIPWQSFACRTDPQAQEVFKSNTGKYLLGLKDKVERSGAKFAVLMTQYSYFFENESFYEPAFPGLKDQLISFGCWADKGKPYQDYVEGFLREHGITYRNPYPVLAEQERLNPTHKLWNYRDYHYSEAGHRIIANEFLELLRPMIAANGAGVATGSQP
jgi:hypothetical protein